MGKKSDNIQVKINPKDYCQVLVDDFFNFVEGNFADLKVVKNVRDIDHPMPPEKSQMALMMLRCSRTWIQFCISSDFPKDTYDLFTQLVSEEWHAREKHT